MREILIEELEREPITPSTRIINWQTIRRAKAVLKRGGTEIGPVRIASYGERTVKISPMTEEPVYVWGTDGGLRLLKSLRANYFSFPANGSVIIEEGEDRRYEITQ